MFRKEAFILTKLSINIVQLNLAVNINLDVKNTNLSLELTSLMGEHSNLSSLIIQPDSTLPITLTPDWPLNTSETDILKNKHILNKSYLAYIKNNGIITKITLSANKIVI